jgi:hypothetical protein
MVFIKVKRGKPSTFLLNGKKISITEAYKKYRRGAKFGAERCVACMDQDAEGGLNTYGCGHDVMCSDCAGRVAQTTNRCPMCRAGPGPRRATIPPRDGLPVVERHEDGSIHPIMHRLIDEIERRGLMSIAGINRFIEAIPRSTLPLEQQDAIISGLREILEHFTNATSAMWLRRRQALQQERDDDEAGREEDERTAARQDRAERVREGRARAREWRDQRYPRRRS